MTRVFHFIMNHVVKIFLEKVKNMGFIITFEGKFHFNYEIGGFSFNFGYHKSSNTIFCINPFDTVKEFYDWGECEKYIKKEKMFIQRLLIE